MSVDLLALARDIRGIVGQARVQVFIHSLLWLIHLWLIHALQSAQRRYRTMRLLN